MAIRLSSIINSLSSLYKHAHSYLLRRQKVVMLFFILSVAVMAIISAILVPAVFSPRSGIPGEIHVSWGEGSGALSPFYTPAVSQDSVFIRKISSGRFQLLVYDIGVRELFIDFSFDRSQQYTPRRLVVRSSYSEMASIQAYTVAGSDTSMLGSMDFTPSDDRVIKGYYVKTYLVPLKTSGTSDHVTVKITRAIPSDGSPTIPFMIEDIGLYESPEGPLYDNRLFLKSFPHDIFIVKLYYEFILLAVIGFLMTLLIVSKRAGRSAVLIYCIVVAFTLVISEYYIGFPPNADKEDLRVLCSTVSLQGEGANLNWGLFMASNLLKGKGFPPYWNRMPGYGLMSILAGITAGDPTNVARMALHMAFIQIMFFIAAITFFTWSAMKIMSHRAAAIMATTIISLPNQFFFTQVDSIMISITLLILGTMFLYLCRIKKSGRVSLVYYLLIHSGFALWFVMRPDVVPGWILTSIFLHRRSWRYYIIPVAFYLIIGLSWGSYKYKKTGDFNMTTAGTGASAFVGLWEIPHKFIWEPSDASSFKVATMLGISSGTTSGSKKITSEVIRFYFTYPGYTISLFYHKFIQFVFYQFSPGYGSQPVRNIMRKYGFALLFLAVALISFLYRYKAMQTLLLSWPVLFNLPFFFLIYTSAGRFYAPHTAAMITYSVPLLMDKHFYWHIFKRPLAAVIILALTLALYFFGESLDKALIGWDAFRYWTPFLDPSDSFISIFKQ